MNFSDIKGHEHTKKYLSSLLSKGRIPQVLLFSGISGIGKEKIAIEMTKALLCNGSTGGCGTCASCRQVEAGTYPDFVSIEPNEKGAIPIGSDNDPEPGSVRWLLQKLSTKSVTGTRVVLIRDFDKTTVAGQNALLKAIEEPGEGVYIFLLTSVKSALLPTILSRTLLLHFSPLSEEDVLSILAAGDGDNNRNSFIAAISGGSMEAAILLKEEKLLNELVAFAGEISQYLRGESFQVPDLGKMVKLFPEVDLISIYIAMYGALGRYILKEHEAQNEYFEKIMLPESATIYRLIRILLAMKRGESHNVNSHLAFRGMLPSVLDPANQDLPYLERLYL